ncbi:MAG: V-type ATP synthase subunit I [Promethearchaeota archaeon]
MIHIKTTKKSLIDEKKLEKNILADRTRKLRDDLDSFFNNIEIFEASFQDLKPDPKEKLKFIVSDLNELVNQIANELDFYTNRYSELERYIARAKIELENLTLIKKSYVFLERFNLKRESYQIFNQLDFKIYITFKKNIENLKTLFKFSEFPNVYQISDISQDSLVFYIIYPKKLEEELKRRINIILAQEIPILKKYLYTDGINFTRIVKEIEIIENTLEKYQKERRRIRDDNIQKFAAFNEIIGNIEKYIWADNQFEELSSQHSLFRFYVPLSIKKKVLKGLKITFKENIAIDPVIITRKRIAPKKKEKTKSTSIENKKKKLVKEKLEQENDLEDSKEEFFNNESDEPPRLTKKHIFFVRPFVSLVKMYGVPSYSEVDPTPFLAITFPLLFGLMFGDIGHGIVLVICGFLGAIIFRNKGENFRNFCWIVFYCGWGAIFGGFLYGESFGMESFLIWHLTPILENPLGDNLVYVLKFAIIIGVIHINLGWTIQAVNYWRQKKKYLAFSDSFIKISLLTGGTILLFIWGFDIDSWFQDPYPILLTLIPGFLLIVLKPMGKIFRISYLKKESYGSLMGEASMEAFETLLSVLSNAASYIRLLALAIAHIALMIAIETLIGFISGEGIVLDILRLIGLIVGNAVVILLEGLMAFVNNIRLHFYEFFFKFYSGSGKEFVPFHLERKFSAIKFKVETDIISEEIEKEIVSKTDENRVSNAIRYINNKFF